MQAGAALQMFTLPFQAELQHFARKLTQSADFKKRFWLISISASVFVMLCIWIYDQFHISTDDAYVNADVVQITPQVSGRVSKLYITNNQTVKKGQLLFEIDPLPFIIAVDRAKAQLALARKSVAEKKAAVAASHALVAVKTAEWQAAKSTSNRMMQLVKRKVLTQQLGDDTTAQFQKASAALDEAKANLSQAEINLGQSNDSNEQIVLAKANLLEAQLNLSYTHIVAPDDGIIANLSLRNGSIVTLHQPLFALISTNYYWVDTNLKETDLKNIRVGQKAWIEVDMYPGHAFKGRVESISGGSGTVFSLLPPQNATGNWVKITQRVPVRVRFIEMNPKYPLRIGTSASVKINV